MSVVKYEAHPLYPAPSAEMIEAMAENWGMDALHAAERYRRLRADMIAQEQGDGFNFPYVPRIWTVVWCLLDWPHWPKALREHAEKTAGCDLWTFMRRMREALGFPDGPVNTVWVSGANRAGKTEMVAYMANATMAAAREKQVYVLSTTEGDSVQAGLHSKLFRYIPREWRTTGKGETGYISYKQKNGFAGNSYVLPNGSSLVLKYYSQEAEEAGEGWEADAVFPDESIPGDWWRRLPARVSSRNGFIVLTNTPQTGYTDVVHEFMGECEITRWAAGYMLPKDGGAAWRHAALGLSEAEYAELVDAHAARPERAPRAPESRSEDCWEWMEIPASKLASSATPAEAAATPAGEWQTARRRLEHAPAVQVGSRLFEAVPRVGRCAGGRRAVVWFHSADNPFGYPRNLVSEMAGLDTERIRCRLYGVVTPSQKSIFARFKRDVHVVKAEAIPKQGTRYLLMDPAPGRNMFMLWILVSGKKRYVYREFPGNYLLPDVGNPGPWAKTSGKKNGDNDGARADGAQSFGWGVARYKAVIAWLEGWVGWKLWAERHGSGDAKTWPRTNLGEPIWPTTEEMDAWEDPAGGGYADEPVHQRLMDPRGGGAVHLDTEGVSTPLGDFNALGVAVDAAFSGTVTSGVEAMISALDYTAEKEPDLYVCEDCVNTVYAMENWKNLDGEASATKDPVDCCRYSFSSDCRDVAPRRVGGGWGESERRRHAGEARAPVRAAEGANQDARRRRPRVRVC